MGPQYVQHSIAFIITRTLVILRSIHCNPSLIYFDFLSVDFQMTLSKKNRLSLKIEDLFAKGTRNCVLQGKLLEPGALEC